MDIKMRFKWNKKPSQIAARIVDRKAKLFFANEVARYMHKYIPMQTGVLRNTKVITPDYVMYHTPYARRLFYKQFKNYSQMGTGPRWDKQMLARHRGDLARTMQRYFKGGGV